MHEHKRGQNRQQVNYGERREGVDIKRPGPFFQFIVGGDQPEYIINNENICGCHVEQMKQIIRPFAHHGDNAYYDRNKYYIVMNGARDIPVRGGFHNFK